MLEIFQQTVQAPIKFKGIGLHSGKVCNLRILPSENDHGIIFKRIDLNENNLIKASYKNVSSAKLCTTLKNTNSVKVSTVEHLLAAFYVCGIDNALIEIDNEEIPIMDGSSRQFFEKIQSVGAKKLSKKRKFLKVLNKIELFDGSKKISIEPNDFSFTVNFQLDYKNKIVGKQKNEINFHTDNLDEIMSSRTFCLHEDIEKIKKLV